MTILKDGKNYTKTFWDKNAMKSLKSHKKWFQMFGNKETAYCDRERERKRERERER